MDNFLHAPFIRLIHSLFLYIFLMMTSPIYNPVSSILGELTH